MKKFLFFLLSFLSAAFAQDIKFSGFGAAGYRYINRILIIDYNQEMYYQGKFQADIDINKHIDSQLDFRAESDEQRVELREFSAKFSYLSRLKFKTGNIKKPFGSEYIEPEEDLTTIDRSFLTETAGKLGYTGRSIGIMAFYNTKDPVEFPHSYYFYIFKNNNQQDGFTGRYVYHFNNFAIGANYFLLNTGGDYHILSHGFASNFIYNNKTHSAEIELMLLQDPVEGIRRQLQLMDNKVFGWGGRGSYSYNFNIDGTVIKNIEPLLLFSYYQPDIKIYTQHTLQLLLGTNFYFDENVRLRINADGLLTKNEYSDKYSTHDSRIVIELQVRY